MLRNDRKHSSNPEMHSAKIKKIDEYGHIGPRMQVNQVRYQIGRIGKKTNQSANNTLKCNRLWFLGASCTKIMEIRYGTQASKRFQAKNRNVMPRVAAISETELANLQKNSGFDLNTCEPKSSSDQIRLAAA